MMEAGVTFIDPSHAYISAEAQIGRDCVIHPDVHIEGKSVIGEGCEIHRARASPIRGWETTVVIKDHCVIVDSEMRRTVPSGRSRTCE